MPTFLRLGFEIVSDLAAENLPALTLPNATDAGLTFTVAAAIAGPDTAPTMISTRAAMRASFAISRVFSTCTDHNSCHHEINRGFHGSVLNDWRSSHRASVQAGWSKMQATDQNVKNIFILLDFSPPAKLREPPAHRTARRGLSNLQHDVTFSLQKGGLRPRTIRTENRAHLAAQSSPKTPRTALVQNAGGANPHAEVLTNPSIGALAPLGLPGIEPI